jgi:hypothetical protein
MANLTRIGNERVWVARSRVFDASAVVSKT